MADHPSARDFLAQNLEFNERCSTIYTDLDASRQEFRLFQIEPGSFLEETVSVTLTTTRLTEKVLYEAISYTWGSLSQTVQIQLCDTPYNVTINQYAALRRLRLADRPRILWMDVICINQANMSEKAQQIGIMGSIYAHSVQTIVWLGEPDDSWVRTLSNWDWKQQVDVLGSFLHSPQFLEEYIPSKCSGLMPAFLKVVRAPQANLLDGALHILDLLDQGVQLGDTPSWSLDPNNEVQFCREWFEAMHALVFIFSRPWWARVWIVQEVALSRGSPQVYIGERKRSLRKFCDVLEALNGIFESGSADSIWKSVLMTDVPEFVAALSTGSTLSTWLRKPSREFDLTCVPDLADGRYVTDPRDFVYGVQGLIREKQKLDIDYSLNVAAIFSKYTWMLLRTLDSCNRLVEAGINDFDRTDGLPSWAIDISRPRAPFWTLYGRAWKSLDLSVPDWNKIGCDHANGVLRLQVRELDRIKHCLRIFRRPSDLNDGSIPANLTYWLSQLESLGVSVPKRPLGSSGERIVVDQPFINFFGAVFRGVRGSDQGFRPFEPGASDFEEISTWWRSFGEPVKVGHNESHSFEIVQSLSIDLFRSMDASTLALTERGKLSMVPLATRDGDLIHHVKACGPLMVLRPVDGGNSKDKVPPQAITSPIWRSDLETFRLVGPCTFGSKVQHEEPESDIPLQSSDIKIVQLV